MVRWKVKVVTLGFTLFAGCTTSPRMERSICSLEESQLGCCDMFFVRSLDTDLMIKERLLFFGRRIDRSKVDGFMSLMRRYKEPQPSEPEPEPEPGPNPMIALEFISRLNNLPKE